MLGHLVMSLRLRMHDQRLPVSHFVHNVSQTHQLGVPASPSSDRTDAPH